MKVDKSIPIPKRRYNERQSKYSLQDLNIGDSFIASPEQIGAIRSRAIKLNIKVTVRKINDDEIRVWRVK